MSKVSSASKVDTDHEASKVNVIEPNVSNMRVELTGWNGIPKAISFLGAIHIELIKTNRFELH